MNTSGSKKANKNCKVENDQEFKLLLPEEHHPEAFHYQQFLLEIIFDAQHDMERKIFESKSIDSYTEGAV